MGNSGKLAVIAAFVSLGLLVLAAVVLEELVLYLFLGAVLVCYLACIVQLFNRRRYLVVLLGAVGTSLFIGFSIAFLRMWGLAFNQDANAMGSAVSTEDSDIYFYLAAVAGVGTLAVMFLGAVVPSFGSRAPAPAKRPASGAKRSPAPRKPTPRPATTVARPGTPAKRPATTAPRGAGTANPTAAKRPAAPRTPAAAAKRPASSSSSQRRPAPKR
ncbi:hypothetical protein IRJ34_03725 [Paenarthrobacter sp. GOM3]|uniref:hypothetical protein n=1 Tax=Paenarthrobacter sp. GOM3 TaxID=2782567 RepID=UPI0020121FF0|nr:hypothetical protein [Paenarthrobacter sp. GOM3]WOH19446.1 hypothetical protein IRJ34_03725 [Paenarthrobacter sp. GOM3]